MVQYFYSFLKKTFSFKYFKNMILKSINQNAGFHGSS